MLNYDSIAAENYLKMIDELIDVLENDKNVNKTYVTDNIINYTFCTKYGDSIFSVELYSLDPELPIALYEHANPYNIGEEKRCINLFINDDSIFCDSGYYNLDTGNSERYLGYLEDFNLYLAKFIRYARESRPNEW